MDYSDYQTTAKGRRVYADGDYRVITWHSDFDRRALVYKVVKMIAVNGLYYDVGMLGGGTADSQEEAYEKGCRVVDDRKAADAQRERQRR